MKRHLYRSIMKYPRTCQECQGVFAHHSSYYRHKKMGRCDRRVEASKIVNQTVNITNNIQYDTKAITPTEHELEIESLRQQMKVLESRLSGESKPPLDEIIYILQTRHSYECGWNVYKIGKTINIKSRKHGYPKGSRLIAYFACRDANIFEKKVLDTLNSCFQKREDFGSEYFEGPLPDIIAKVTSIYIEHEEGIANY